MLTAKIAGILWNDARAWNDSNYLVQSVCESLRKSGNGDPKYSSVIRIAARLKAQLRFQNRKNRLH